MKFSEGFPSGQRGQTVNLLAQPSEVRILPPPPSGGWSYEAEAKILQTRWRFAKKYESGGCSSTVEPQPSKLMMWVRFPSPAPVLRVLARIAQSVEHLHGKEGVTGSNPVAGSKDVRQFGPINLFDVIVRKAS